MIAATMAFIRTKPRRRVFAVAISPTSVRPHPLIGRLADKSLLLALQHLRRREGAHRAVVRLRH
jgi:hypothetical protein